MKPIRILEFIGVPLALAVAGSFGAQLATRLIGLLGREYGTANMSTGFQILFLTCASGLAAGLAAVVVQRRKTGRARWSFYGLLALSQPFGAALILLIEALRPDFSGFFGVRAMADTSRVPFWILAAGFWLPFLTLLRKKAPEPA